MPLRVCEGCREQFWQGQGRPARTCPRCRGDAAERYGPVHRQLKAASDQAVGQPCSRCRQPLLEGQVVSPDHLDGGGPTDYAGWAHAACNLSAGASYGNRLRAAAYRAAVGLQASAGNGVGLLVGEVLVDDHACTDHGCHADPERCSCGRHSRGW